MSGASRKRKDADKLKKGIINLTDIADDEAGWNNSRVKNAFDLAGIEGFERHFCLLGERFDP